MAKLEAFDTGQFAEKISALSIYDSNLLTMLYQNPVNKQKINRGAALLVRNYFDLYLDSRARQNPSAYHHVYEFEKTGNPTARLFKAVVTNAPDGSAVINYSFNQAKDPNPEGYPFPNKADVMEKGETIIVTPKRGRYLRYRLEDGQFVTSEKSVIRNPGGDQVRGSFESTFRSFMISQSSIILQKFRFFEKIELSILNKRRLSIPRINSGMTADAANRAKIDAMSIADGVVSTYA
jgi:hypothetical protein